MAPRVVVDIDSGYKAIIKNLDLLSRASVVVGIQENAKTKYQYKNGLVQPAGELIATYAAENEFGTNKIPQRSFIRSAFDENLNTIERVAEDQYIKILDRKITINQGLGTVGQVVVALIKRKINTISFPPNSPATIAIKKSSKPLIDFGQMIANVTYAIRLRK